MSFYYACFSYGFKRKKQLARIIQRMTTEMLILIHITYFFLEDVQLRRVFPDGKTFVDCLSKYYRKINANI
jgi:hypothetical protein